MIDVASLILLAIAAASAAGVVVVIPRRPHWSLIRAGVIVSILAFGTMIGRRLTAPLVREGVQGWLRDVDTAMLPTIISGLWCLAWLLGLTGAVLVLWSSTDSPSPPSRSSSS